MKKQPKHGNPAVIAALVAEIRGRYISRWSVHEVGGEKRVFYTYADSSKEAFDRVVKVTGIENVVSQWAGRFDRWRNQVEEGGVEALFSEAAE